MTTRRERHRAATIDEIKQAALDQIAREGASALSIRGIAREIGMSPAGLYRYYQGLDELITELVTDAYCDLAEEVEAAIGSPGTAIERLREGMLAYRRWCVGHPNRFLLIFGTPIPGYQAPEAGPTVQANRRIGAAFFMAVVDGWQSGELALPESPHPPTPREKDFVAASAPGFPPASVGPFLGTWAHFHGMVTLEILHQLDWVYPDAEDFYRSEIDRVLASWDSGAGD